MNCLAGENLDNRKKTTGVGTERERERQTDRQTDDIGKRKK